MTDFVLETKSGNSYEISLCVREAPEREGFSFLDITVKMRFRPTISLAGYIKRNKISNNLKADENATLLTELLG